MRRSLHRASRFTSVHHPPASFAFLPRSRSVRPPLRSLPQRIRQQGHEKDTGARLSVPGFGQRNPSVSVLGGLLPGQGFSRCPLDPQSQGCCCNLPAAPPTKSTDKPQPSGSLAAPSLADRPVSQRRFSQQPKYRNNSNRSAAAGPQAPSCGNHTRNSGSRAAERMSVL